MLPFLKWAGGKRWLFESQQYSLPFFTGTYFEPFLGGGAVFFNTLPNRSHLSDTNKYLIETYQSIKENPHNVEKLLKNHANSHNKDYYYTIRSKNYDNKYERSAKFIYLNRTCWNGLYRENQKGEFNVPIGTKDTVIFGNDDFSSWSNAMKNSEIVAEDFENSINRSKEGDFIFADPPYTVKHNMNGFVKYNQHIFAWEDQVRLRDSLKRAYERGVTFALTNADHESIRDLYSDFPPPRQLSRYSVISGKAQYRSQSTELLVIGTPFPKLHNEMQDQAESPEIVGA
ncbi:MAG: Dam family site-specific DNA-(adenine-N6)-methyltransferase [Pseudomonadota bacterium]